MSGKQYVRTMYGLRGARSASSQVPMMLARVAFWAVEPEVTDVQVEGFELRLHFAVEPRTLATATRPGRLKRVDKTWCCYSKPS